MDGDKNAEQSSKVETPAAPAAPAPPAAPVTAGAKPPVNAGLIVLQWLTYAFWGWTVLSLSVLTTLVLNSFLNDADTAGFMPYGIAAILVLLPISYICDAFYSKKEPEHKVGPETWVMIFHAVIFALFGIGALIAAVIAAVMLVTNGTGSKGTQVALYSALIITVYYALTFVRTLNPPKFTKLAKWYKLIMLVSVGIIALLGIVGPLAKERATRNDRLIVDEISTVENGIDTYAQDKKRLPDNLRALDLEDDAKRLVDQGLVKYKPEGKYEADSSDAAAALKDLTASTPGKPGSSLTITKNSAGPDEYRYQLCVTYTRESSNYSKYKESPVGPDSDSEYQGYVSAYSHPKGDVCYKLKVEVY